jgi:hypothetical protein
MNARGAALLLAAILTTACGDRRAGGGPAGPRPAEGAAARPRPDAAEPVDRGPPLDEGPARRLVAGRFRDAGLRVVEDVQLTAPVVITLDGFDPERRVGFEYVAPEEARDLAEVDRAALERSTDPRVLVLPACGADRCAEAADAFLSRLPPAPSGDTR